ncbi:MAG TPA: MFS transporter, partial [Xanthobacteraceae bacterium]
MTEAVIGRQKTGTDTAFAILAALTFCHLLNDLATSLLPAIYPILKSGLDLTFGQIGLLTFVYQGVASLLQPVIGLFTDRRPQPYSLPIGMACVLLGLAAVAFAPAFIALLAGAALMGVGSAVFHPESSRLARLASGGAHGFAQSLFQVGGNFGNSLGPLAAAFFILPRGQSSLVWFALLALAGMIILSAVGRWYQNSGHIRKSVARSASAAAAVPARLVRRAIAVLVLLIFSKFFYLSSITSYYIFYLMHRFDLPTQTAQICLFVFLAASAAGTFIGGPIGD